MLISLLVDRRQFVGGMNLGTPGPPRSVIASRFESFSPRRRSSSFLENRFRWESLGSVLARSVTWSSPPFLAFLALPCRRRHHALTAAHRRRGAATPHVRRDDGVHVRRHLNAILLVPDPSPDHFFRHRRILLQQRLVSVLCGFPAMRRTN